MRFNADRTRDEFAAVHSVNYLRYARKHNILIVDGSPALHRRSYFQGYAVVLVAQDPLITIFYRVDRVLHGRQLVLWRCNSAGGDEQIDLLSKDRSWAFSLPSLAADGL